MARKPPVPPSNGVEQLLAAGHVSAKKIKKSINIFVQEPG